MKDLFANNNEDSSEVSIYLYKKLIELATPIRDVYLKNVERFENQLMYSDINSECYIKMYSSVSPDETIPSLRDLEDQISGLSDLNKAAYKYFNRKRNNSVKGLDVQLGNQFDECFINFLNSQGINAMRADTKNKRLPDIMILDKTRNIKAYIEHKYHNAPFMLSWKLIGRESYEGSITMDLKKIHNQINECESEIPGRPVFFVHWVDFHHLKGIFFNTLEQIKDYIGNGSEFQRKARKGDYSLTKKIGYTEKFYPPLHEMGDFRELISFLK